MSVPIRVVIAEDHVLFRQGMKQLLEASGRIEVAAETGDAAMLLEEVERLGPDAVVVDIRLPPEHSTEGIEAARWIRSTCPGVGVLVLSQYASPIYAFELFQDGTAGLGYLLKDRVGDADELVRAVVAVASGGSVIDPQIVDGLLARWNTRSRSSAPDLTEREYEVLAQMAQGKSNSAIAIALGVSESSVEKHINALLAKLGLEPDDSRINRRVAAVLRFLRSDGRVGERGY